MELVESFALMTIITLGAVCCYYAFRVQTIHERIINLEEEIEQIKGIQNESGKKQE